MAVSDIGPADRSSELFTRACAVLPGGVNSPVRAFGAVGGQPLFVEHGEGCRLIDVDGQEYVDYVMSWGPLIHGHAFAPVLHAIESAARRGTSFGAPTEIEVLLAEEVVDSVPSIQMVRFVSSGTEATMSAIRVARAFTGRDLIVKFAGNYHGHSDALLAEAGSGSLTLGIPNSPGVPAAITATTVVAPFNDVDALKAVFQAHGAQIAAVIVEPIAANMGVVLPTAEFVESLRTLPQASGALLICDEVITGFRVGRGGAQQMLGLDPDLTTLGKIVGGGLPVGAYGGRADIMRLVAPLGPVYQAGTLSGNPLAMAAGLATLLPLRDPEVYVNLEATTRRLVNGIRAIAAETGVPLTVNASTGMLTVFFNAGVVDTLETVQASDRDRYAHFFRAMLNQGIYLPPSPFEAWMLSTSHSPDAIDRTLQSARAALAAVA